MRENRTCGSEGGEAQSLPYPYPVTPAYPVHPALLLNAHLLLIKSELKPGC